MFGDKKVFLPVIHVAGPELEVPMDNVRMAADAQADGVFIINHGSTVHDLIDLKDMIKDEYPSLWLGMNVLGRGIGNLHPASFEVDGIWVDEAMSHSGTTCARYLAQKQHAGYKGLLFGGVYFKSSRTPSNIEELIEWCERAKKYCDYITTSGSGTGIAASVDKIRTMKGIIGSHKMAIASGVTPENVHQYLPHVDAFLVATGISKDFWHFDKQKVDDLSKAIRNFKKEISE